jgi:uncharacterized protein (TIGR02996 family)
MFGDPFLEEVAENPQDLALRHVYADWLEEQGDPRAPFLRVMLTLAELHEGDPGYLGLTSDKERLREQVDVEWQRKLGYCVEAEFDARVETHEFCWAFRCPQQWAGLRPTESPEVRYCTECRMEVHFCATPEELAEHVKLKHCVALNPVVDDVSLDGATLELDYDITLGVLMEAPPPSDNRQEDLGDGVVWRRGYPIP